MERPESAEEFREKLLKTAERLAHKNMKIRRYLIYTIIVVVLLTSITGALIYLYLKLYNDPEDIKNYISWAASSLGLLLFFGYLTIYLSAPSQPKSKKVHKIFATMVTHRLNSYPKRLSAAGEQIKAANENMDRISREFSHCQEIKKEFTKAK